MAIVKRFCAFAAASNTASFFTPNAETAAYAAAKDEEIPPPIRA